MVALVSAPHIVPAATMPRLLAIGALFLIAICVVAFVGPVVVVDKAPIAAGAAVNWPCPLPTAEGERAVVVIEKRGRVFDVTCRGVRLPMEPIAPKGGTS